MAVPAQKIRRRGVRHLSVGYAITRTSWNIPRDYPPDQIHSPHAGELISIPVFITGLVLASFFQLAPQKPLEPAS